MLKMNNDELKILLTYAYEISKNISPEEGKKVQAGTDEVSDVYKEAIFALINNQKISKKMKKMPFYKKLFDKFFVPNLSMPIEHKRDDERYIKAVLLQYSSDLIECFKQTKYFVVQPATIESLLPNKVYIEEVFQMSLEEFFVTIYQKEANRLRRFLSMDYERLFRIKTDMDLQTFYHKAALMVLGKPISLEEYELMDSTYDQIESATNQFLYGGNIQYNGYLFGTTGTETGKHPK